MKYVGFISALVGKIRSIRTPTGHGFQVVHAPEGGQGQHHAEICYAPRGGQTLGKAEKVDLKFRLRSVFGELIEAS